MPSLNLSHIVRRNPDRVTLKERADRLRASAARVIRRGRETAPAADPPPAPSPGAAMLEAIMAEWSGEWTATTRATAGQDTPETEAAWRRADERRLRLLRAAEALPATRDNVPAKALALAWIEHVELEGIRRSREDYATDGKLAFDINAALTETDAPAGSGSLASRFAPAIAASFDIGAQSLQTLAFLHGVAVLLGEVATAATCQPRCSDGGHFGAGYNAAGHLADFVDTLCGQIARQIQQEARQRVPADRFDAAHKLGILAQSVAESDEPSEMQAFAADLHAEAVRIARNG
ncbi:hypothetical protein [Methylobacterium organophilum]|uniref:Uncharacterized protein n=1 Tax=Methylobacterium organophilum TaxID=410 RepID=A0ABQ4TCX7_METOR|nr:hypothetical protein [Methylobacterium organophilum]GJE29551.1 hypothetical protein LKMONMHP_4433 [Methylobacterium organophilum]